MNFEKDSAKANPSEPQFQQTALKDVTAGHIHIEQIVQKIVNLGLLFNSQHLQFAQFLANTVYISLLVIGFWRLRQHGADGQTLFMLVLGSVLLSLTGVYYAWFWKPEMQDKRSQRVRRFAMIACVAIPLLTGSGFFAWRALPPPQILVLVSNFANSQNADYRDDRGVTERILRNLIDTAEPYTDVKVQTLDQTIRIQDGSDVARNIGEQKKAAIVIWGDYTVTDTHVQISTHFEVLKPPSGFPELEPTANGEAQTLEINEINSFELQTRLSNEMAYLTLFTLGTARHATKDWNGAIACFSDALAQVDNTALVLNQSVVFSYRGLSYLAKGDYPQAIADYTQAINLQPGNAEFHNNRGAVYILKEDYSEAIVDFNQALKFDHNAVLAASIYKNRGAAYNQQKNYIQAIADFNQAVELKPNDAGSYYNRGVVYTMQNNHIKAIADYDLAIKLEPHSPEAYVNRGIAYGNRENYTQAITDFNQALKFNPNSALAYYNRGITYFRQGNDSQAISDYTQAIKIDPGYFSAYNKRGLIYKSQSNCSRAISDFTQTIKLQPNDSIGYNNRGNTYESQGSYSQAIADFTQAIKLQPNFAVTYHNRGNAYRGQRNYTQAISDYTQAIRLQQNLVGAYYSRAGVYNLEGNVKAALEDLQRAIDLDGSFRELAKIDVNFNSIRQNRNFQALIGLQDNR